MYQFHLDIFSGNEQANTWLMYEYVIVITIFNITYFDGLHDILLTNKNKIWECYFEKHT